MWRRMSQRALPGAAVISWPVPLRDQQMPAVGSGGMDQKLMAILHEQLRSYPYSENLAENGGAVFATFARGNIDTFVTEMQHLRGPMLKEAALPLDAQR